MMLHGSLIEHPMDDYDLVVDDCGICGGDGFSCINIALSLRCF